MNKPNRMKKLSQAVILGFVSLASGCGLMPGNSAPNSTATATATQLNVITGPASTVPTADAVVTRILAGLSPGGVTVGTNNFRAAFARVNSNLPQTSDPLKANGQNQIPLLAYAACSDITPSLVKSVYGVDTTKSVSTQASNLTAAGVIIVNQYVGGLASNGSINTQVNQVFNTLVTNDNTSGASTAMTFISVCTAAVSFGVGMLGF